MTSEWGTPDTFENGLVPEILLGSKYGRRLHFWDFTKRKHLQEIDFGEEHPDEAVESWRKCLMTSAGTDAETSWWLAYALIQIGRVAEAKPLIGQYRRLAGLESPKLRFLEAVLDEQLLQLPGPLQPGDIANNL